MSATPYVCGHSGRELDRLDLQGAVFRDITRRVLEAAGLSAGMRVLDVGCGAGDVSLVAAELVGERGSVLGVDRAPASIQAATARAVAQHLRHVTFQVGEISDLGLLDVDALIGRFVLMHQPDPAATLRAAARAVRPGGVVAMLESHLAGAAAGVHSHPHSATYDLLLHWIVRVLKAAGVHTDMGLRLPGTFAAAGLARPSAWWQARVDTGPDSPIYRYMAESVRSMFPLARHYGISGLVQTELDGLESRLRAEVMQSSGVVTSPPVVGAWCRT